MTDAQWWTQEDEFRVTKALERSAVENETFEEHARAALASLPRPGASHEECEQKQDCLADEIAALRNDLTEMDASREAAFKAGIEAAAQWHDEEVSRLDDVDAHPPGLTDYGKDRRLWHKRASETIRAFAASAEKPVEEITFRAELSTVGLWFITCDVHRGFLVVDRDLGGALAKVPAALAELRLAEPSGG
jgi:hypothetical protein